MNWITAYCFGLVVIMLLILAAVAATADRQLSKRIDALEQRLKVSTTQNQFTKP